MRRFEEPLRDYIKVVHAVKVALHRRHEKRLAYSARLATVESKNVALAKLRGQPGMEGKAYAAEMSLRRANEAADVARDEFAATSQRVLREVDRFKREKAEDMRDTVLDYITLQVEYNRRMEVVWAELIPQLESVRLDAGGGGGGGVGDGQGQGGPTAAPPQRQVMHDPQIQPAPQPPQYTNAPPPSQGTSMPPAAQEAARAPPAAPAMAEPMMTGPVPRSARGRILKLGPRRV